MASNKRAKKDIFDKDKFTIKPGDIRVIRRADPTAPTLGEILKRQRERKGPKAG